MKPTRGVGLPAAVSAGIIASSIGNATVAPIARRNVRLGSAFFVTNIACSSRVPPETTTKSTNGRRGVGGFASFPLPRLPHVDRLALPHRHDQRRHRVLAGGCLVDDRADRRLIVELQVPS